jgi:hypothetical protein
MVIIVKIISSNQKKVLVPKKKKKKLTNDQCRPGASSRERATHGLRLHAGSRRREGYLYYSIIKFPMGTRFYTICVIGVICMAAGVGREIPPIEFHLLGFLIQE